MGYTGDIDLDTEQRLANKTDKVLVMTDLPQGVKDAMSRCHIGENMKYDMYETPTEVTQAEYHASLMRDIIAERNKIFE